MRAEAASERNRPELAEKFEDGRSNPVRTGLVDEQSIGREHRGLL